jgi:hypothetical protein
MRFAAAVRASNAALSSAPSFCQREDCVLVTPRSDNWVAGRNSIRPRPPASRSPFSAISASNCPALRSE